jgi:fructokinase
MADTRFQIVCYGELFWNIMRDTHAPGGSPFNILTHLQKLNKRAVLISRIGNDDAGKDLVHELKERKIMMDFCQVDGQHITGVQNIVPQTSTKMFYEIVYPAAWDFIEFKPTFIPLVSAADYFVFGSISTRNIESRNTLFELLKYAKTKVFDLNIRAPHYNRGIIEKLLHEANILKLNINELEILSEWYGEYFDEFSSILMLKKKFTIQTILVTKGAEGAILNMGNRFYSHPGYKVRIADTLGSSDSFLAAFLSKLIDGSLPLEILDFTCALSSMVTARNGPMPEYRLQEVFETIE